MAQAAKIRKQFPNSRINVNRNILTWKGTLTPSPLSNSYDIKLEYKIGYHPCVYVINRKLKLHPNKEYLPHVYDTEEQWLCVYYRKAQEWNNQLYIADTIIPWTSEWLYHYEFWLASGDWYGRGIHLKFKPFEKDKSSAPDKE